MATLGIVCGMEAEARTLGPVRDHDRVIVIVTGGRADRVDRAARRFLNEGCIRMLSWGVAGGLDPRLQPGEALMPDMVETLEGERFALARHAALGDAAAEEAPGALMLGVDAPVLSAGDKATLYHATGAVAVDMETHRLARIGAEYAVDTLAIRAVADPAERDLPAYLADALDGHGRPRLGHVLGGLIRRPGTLGALLGLRRDRARALARLRRIAISGPDAGIFARLLA